MEVNKEEALRCLDVARRHLENGDLEKAKKFAAKSVSMYPTDEGNALLAKIEHSKRHRPSAQSAAQEQSPRTGESETRRRHTAHTSGQENGAATGEYTREQVEAVLKIKACKSYYEVLGVPRDASDADIKKAYRKMALQFHPDKNKAPGADDAFKSIGKAFSVLNDEGLRRQYDAYGEEAANRAQQRGGGHTHSPFGASNVEAFTAEEIFQMFFNGVHPNDIRAHRARHRNRQYSYNHGGFGNQQMHANMGLNVMHMLPFILVVLLTLFSGQSYEQRAFDLRQTTSTPVARMTARHEVPYFVSTTFDQEKHDLNKVEEQVERYYAAALNERCVDEKRWQQREMSTAKFYGDTARLNRAASRKMQACDELENFRRKLKQ